MARVSVSCGTQTLWGTGEDDEREEVEVTIKTRRGRCSWRSVYPVVIVVVERAEVVSTAGCQVTVNTAREVRTAGGYVVVQGPVQSWRAKGCSMTLPEQMPLELTPEHEADAASNARSRAPSPVSARSAASPGACPSHRIRSSTSEL